MRRIVLLLLVAGLAFLAGTAGANGTLARLLNAVAVAIGPTVAPTAAPSATNAALPRTAITVVVVTATPVHMSATQARPVGATGAPSATPATPRPTAAPTRSPSPSPSPTPVPPPAPVGLEQKAPGGHTLGANAWAGAAGLTLRVLAPALTADTRAEVEVRPLGQPFTGQNNFAGPVNHGVADIPLRGLAAGHYHWQARLSAATGSSRWVPFAHGAGAFGVQLIPPSAPVVTSSTNPQPHKTYASSTLAFAWSTSTDPSGIVGYSYRLDKDPHGEAPQKVRTRAQQVLLGGIDTGSYYFHVRAVDAVGNWGPTTTYPVRVDVTKPELTHTRISGYYINPMLESLRLSFTLSKVSTVTVGIYKPPYSMDDRIRHIVLKQLMPAGVPLKVNWDGRDDAGNIVPPGSYAVWLKATDRLGNSHSIPWGNFIVTDKRIVISLSQQRLWAYQGNNLLWTTLVTTGNKLLPTPTGTFHILFGKSPFTFHSPWPQGSPYWYPDSKVSYALYFHDYGFYIHDAPWRTFFGPGSNAVVGKPGQNLTGTHGCVNVPEDVMRQLYTWATPGTAVQINP